MVASARPTLPVAVGEKLRRPKTKSPQSAARFDGLTVVGSVAVLSAPVGLLSPGSDTMAVLVTLDGAARATLTVSAIVLELKFPGRGPGLAQVTTWPTVGRHVQPRPVPKTKVR